MCNCAQKTKEKKQYSMVLKLAQKEAKESGKWTVVYFLPCGNWEFSYKDNFTPDGKKTYNIAHHCKDVTLDEFEDCLLNNNLNRLIRSGKPTTEELQEAWEKLFNEFSVLSENKQYVAITQARNTILKLTCKLAIAEGIITLLSAKYTKQLEELALKEGYKVTKESFDRVISTKAKKLIVTLESKKKELEALVTQTGNKKSLGFDEQLVTLSRFQGYRIDKTTITLFDYTVLVNQYKKNLKSNERRKNN